MVQILIRRIHEQKIIDQNKHRKRDKAGTINHEHEFDKLFERREKCPAACRIRKSDRAKRGASGNRVACGTSGRVQGLASDREQNAPDAFQRTVDSIDGDTEIREAAQHPLLAVQMRHRGPFRSFRWAASRGFHRRRVCGIDALDVFVSSYARDERMSRCGESTLLPHACRAAISAV